MRSLALSLIVCVLTAFPAVVAAQEAAPAPTDAAPENPAAPAAAREAAPSAPEAPAATPAVEEDSGPTAVVVMATGGTDVTEAVLSQARLATVSSINALREEHGREARPERDPGLALRASNCADDACLVAVGQDAQAAFLFVLMIERNDAGHRLTVLLVDVNAGMTAGSAAFALPADPATFNEAIREPLGPLLSAVTSVFPTTGTLTITVDQEGAAIVLDGEQAGTSPLEPLAEVEGGPHDLRVTLEGYQDFAQTIEVEAGGETAVSVTMEPTPPDAPPPPPPTPIWRRWWFWTAIGAVVVGTGLGVGLGVGLSGGDDTHVQTGIEFPGWEQR